MESKRKGISLFKKIFSGYIIAIIDIVIIAVIIVVHAQGFSKNAEKVQEEILPNTTDAANEKHVPVVNVEGNKVTVNVGTAPHPMTDAHYIGWVVLCTNLGNQRKLLSPDSEPKAEFLLLENESVEACYAYCNLHGLWKA